MVQTSGEIENILRVSIKIVLAGVLLTPLIVMADPLPGSYFPFVVGKALYSRTMIEIAFGLWVILALRSPEYRVSRSWLLLLFAIYVFVAYLASLLGVSPQRSLWSTYERMQGVVDLVHWFAFVWVLAAVFRIWEDWYRVLNVSLGVSLYMGLLGLGQYYQIGLVVDQFDYLKSTTRLDITLGNPTYVGAYMLGNVFIALGFLSHSYLSMERLGRITSHGRSSKAARDKNRIRKRSGRSNSLSANTICLGLWLGVISIGSIYFVGQSSWGVLLYFVANIAIVSLVFRDEDSPVVWRWSALGFLLLSSVVIFVVDGAADKIAMAFWIVALRMVYVNGKPNETAWRSFWITVIVLDTMILYLSGTRGAFVGLLSGILCFSIGYLIWGRLSHLRLVSLSWILGLIGLVLLFLFVRDTTSFAKISSSNSMILRLTHTDLADQSVIGRITSMSVGFEGFVKKPVFGWGPENFSIAYDRYVTSEMVTTAVTSFDQAHNKLLEELTTKGILGFSAYLSLWIYMGYVFVNRLPKQDNAIQIFTLFAGASLAAYFVQNLFLFDTPGTAPWLYLLVGFVVFVDRSSCIDDKKLKKSGPRALDFVLRREFLISRNSLISGVSIAAIFILVTIFSLNYRALVASQTYLGTVNQTRSWDQRLDSFQRTVDMFPQLANYPRAAMFTQLDRNWHNLTTDEASKALNIVTKEGMIGIKAEPEEWRIYLALASVYQAAATTHIGTVERARELVDKGASLAPTRLETIQMQAFQHVMEDNPAAALTVIDTYVGENPQASRFFTELRGQIIKVLDD